MYYENGRNKHMRDSYSIDPKFVEFTEFDNTFVNFDKLLSSNQSFSFTLHSYLSLPYVEPFYMNSVVRTNVISESSQNYLLCISLNLT